MRWCAARLDVKKIFIPAECLSENKLARICTAKSFRQAFGFQVAFLFMGYLKRKNFILLSAYGENIYRHKRFIVIKTHHIFAKSENYTRSNSATAFSTATLLPRTTESGGHTGAPQRWGCCCSSQWSYSHTSGLRCTLLIPLPT